MSNGKRNQSSRRKQGKEKPSARNQSNDVMEDVMEQLRKQRQKRSDAAAASNMVHDRAEDITKDDEQQRPADLMGNFRYDPILKRYLPKSTLKPNGNNDACIQQMQQASLEKLELLVERHIDDAIGQFSATTVTDGEMRRIIFRGYCLKSNVEHKTENIVDNHCADRNMSYSGEREHRKSKKRKKQNDKIHFNGKKADTDDAFNHAYKTKLPCSEKSILLLAASLSYCTASRRKTTASILGPLCIARGLDIAPTVATKDMLLKSRIGCVVTSDERTCNNSLFDVPKSSESKKKIGLKGTKMTKAATPQSKWYTMLYPISFSGMTER
jgi:hypothetical protein